MTAGAARNELWDAIYAEDYPRVQKLLETGGGERWVNEPHGAWKNTSVHVATVKENRKILNILIVHKGDVNAINVNGTTPLHIAVEKENRELVQCLLQSGAKLHKRNVIPEDASALLM
ncbi:unnamed protein product [Aphanomyces euteiches]|uniref:Uncharacterized protein n=1 Tax=Aphanomyces euteiches TaxID=100861 RepID=A0A6G0XYL6_9STRA|nr:hypothetical protein Ae201684_000070 [Aphanomyces euteiches]KAH9146247.1 hypothetical protein AeRB84_009834 [Aphanomyces euteiches]